MVRVCLVNGKELNRNQKREALLAPTTALNRREIIDSKVIVSFVAD